MDPCEFCDDRHADNRTCPWKRLADKIELALYRSLDPIVQALTTILAKEDQLMSQQGDLDTELTTVESTEAAEETELTQESADLKTLLAAIPASTAINLAPEIARLQTLAATMGSRTTTATADDASITAETATLGGSGSSGSSSASAAVKKPSS